MSASERGGGVLILVPAYRLRVHADTMRTIASITAELGAARVPWALCRKDAVPPERARNLLLADVPSFGDSVRALLWIDADVYASTSKASQRVAESLIACARGPGMPRKWRPSSGPASVAMATRSSMVNNATCPRTSTVARPFSIEG
jgi:hypothetical protein